MKIHEALSAVMDDVRSVGKTERNTHQNYNFRGIDAVVNAVGPALRTHKIVVVPRVLSIDGENVSVGRNNTPMRSVTVTVEYVFWGPEGDSISAISVGEAMDSGDKAVPKAMSVALRTCLLQALMLPTDEPDPDSFSYDRTESAKFDPADRSTWPDTLTVAQAKKVIVVECGGDKEMASQAWKSLEIANGPISGEDMEAILVIVREFATDGKPF
jgi:hypothetical protein